MPELIVFRISSHLINVIFMYPSGIVLNIIVRDYPANDWSIVCDICRIGIRDSFEYKDDLDPVKTRRKPGWVLLTDSLSAALLNAPFFDLSY